MKFLIKLLFTTLVFFNLTACDNNIKPANDLKITLIRHGEKPKVGDNLSCKGQNRALQLTNVLYEKLKAPYNIYVPALSLDKTTSHSRMFQTVTPFAVKYNLAINSQYEDDDYDNVSKSVQKKHGDVLMVWSHQSIPKLARALGIKNPPEWQDDDFDSMWLISYHDGKANLSFNKEGLSPPEHCIY